MKKRISVSAAKQKGRLLQQLVCQKVANLTGLSYGPDEPIFSRPMGQSGTDVGLVGEAREAFPFSVECFTAGTLIVTKQGMVPIEKIQIGNKVLTHLGRFRKVTNIFKQTSDKLISLKSTISAESIHTTEDHPFEGFYGEWNKAKNTKIFSHIIHSNNGYQTVKTNFLLPENTHGNQIQLTKNIPIDKNFMSFIGWCIAEGNFTKDRVQLTFSSKEKDTISRLAKYCKSTFNLNSKITFVKNTCILCLNSIQFSRFVVSLIGKGSRNVKLGEFLFYDKKLLAPLIKTYFLGDGCFDGKNARFTTVSRQLAYETQFALLRFGIFSRIAKAIINRPTPLYDVIVSRSTMPIFMAILNEEKWKYKKISINSDDREVVYAQYKQRMYTDIKAHKKIPNSTTVYNFSVEEDESYIIEGGIIVHNCKRQEKLSIPKWIEQAQANTLPGTDWLLVFKRSRTKPVVCLDMDTFFNLLKEKK